MPSASERKETVGEFEFRARSRRLREHFWRAMYEQEHAYDGTLDRNGKRRVSEQEMQLRDALFETAVALQRRCTRDAEALGWKRLSDA